MVYKIEVGSKCHLDIMGSLILVLFLSFFFLSQLIHLITYHKFGESNTYPFFKFVL